MNKDRESFTVETRALCKVYSGKTAVNRLEMKVREGAVYGFIGRNGAGKSTTLKMLCGLAKPTAGEVRLFGRPSNDRVVARRIGCLIESTGLYPHMTARQNVVMKARCMGLADESGVDRVLSAVGLSEAGNKKTRQFSMGMKQRLGVALALLGNPDLLILDEPINGLDPEGIREMRRLILELNEEGKTFIISSHILGELSKIATHYGIIKEGELVEQVSREALEAKCKDYYEIEVNDTRRALPLIEEKAPNIEVRIVDGRSIRLFDLQEGAWLNQLLIESGLQIYSSGFHQMDLEEYFLKRMDGINTENNTGRTDNV